MICPNDVQEYESERFTLPGNQNYETNRDAQMKVF
jgi:hypothetical protein